MSLGRKFLSGKFSNSFRELDRRTKEKEEKADAGAEEYEKTWSAILPELLGEIIQRLEATDDRWQRRQDVVASAGVCKWWREITKETFNSHLRSGTITFPSCLKQPGPSDSSHQFLIRRNKKTFYLYLAQSPSLTDKRKFLLAARRYRRASHIEYTISLHADDFSQRSNAFVGKLSSDFLATNFTIYDSEPPHSGARPLSSRASRCFSSNQISPQLPASNYEMGHISYKFNLLKSRGPRRMVCSIKCLNSSSTESSNSTTTPSNKDNPRMKKKTEHHVVLKNKAPRWHEQLQCWCLNFHGRVTVASVKNFQLVSAAAAANESRQVSSGGKGDDERVLLQFGRVDDDLFTMDYRHPLSAFQAFAICLTSFGTKIACE